MTLAHCAVCDQLTRNDARWGNNVCDDCRERPVLFAACCRICGWTTTAEENEYNRGRAKQTAQREANAHETRADLAGETHSTDVWEIDHPDRETHLPSRREADR